MQVPSAGQVLVELQKGVTQLHRIGLQSPLAPFLRRVGSQEFLVLETRGRRSGARRSTPLSFTRDGDAFVVIASNGGAARDPDWYKNLEARPQAWVEVAGARRPVRATTVAGGERDRLWRQAVRSYPGYLAYQRRAAREIPVVRLVPDEDRGRAER
jgi:deazaflavin-dependent oxidoreductase (nitroreductase family)